MIARRPTFSTSWAATAEKSDHRDQALGPATQTVDSSITVVWLPEGLPILSDRAAQA